MQQSETTLYWQQNGLFAVVFSILILAVSQFSTHVFQIIIAALGIVLSCAWILIQYRSSVYVGYWKKEFNKFDAEIGSSTYPKLKGVQMRYMAYSLSGAFLIVWIIFLVLGIYPELIEEQNRKPSTEST
jgi:NADH:ubiquinone oxidoreductase subunit 4 (subunit M)